MIVRNCAEVRRRLEAFHDGELAVSEHVAVASHLQTCEACARDARLLDLIGHELRRGALDGRADAPDLASLGPGVVGRFEAERDASLPARLRGMFDDMHLVWAGLSASMATVTCAALLFAIWFLSPPERADSLAGIMAALAAPGSDRNPVSLDHRIILPRVTTDVVVPAALAASVSEEDLVFALAAVVTREGRIARSEVLSVNRQDREVVLRLMNAVSEARFKPASLSGNPVAVNLVWLVTHTTVRGKAHS